MPSKKKTLFTTHLSTDREKKNLLFFNLIKSHKSISRTEISNLTNINIVTVSNYINSYLKKSLALERGYDISSGGRRPELVELNKNWGYTIGIDIGTGCVKGVITDLSMEILASETIRNYEKKDLNTVIDGIVKKLLSVSNTEKERTKRISLCTSKDSKKATKIIIKEKDTIENTLGIPTLVGDGALCAAFGEKNLNPNARETSTILYIYKDTGEGILIKDDEFYQANDEELENTYLKPWGRKISIASEAKRIAEEGIGTAMVEIAGGSIENITAEVVIKAAKKQQDEVCTDLLRMAGMNLGVRVAYLINSFEPEIVIIGGGIEEAGSLFFEPLTSSINKFMRQKISDKVKVVPAVLGKDACVKGGAFLAIREAFIEG